MSAQSLEVVTFLFSDPAWSDTTSSGTDFRRLNSSLAYEYVTSFNIRTLSTNSASTGSGVTGLLYVPDLPVNGTCYNASAPYVPANVTRQSDLPDTDDNLIALAPWVSANCTLAYLASADDDPIRAFLFYIPDSGTAIPPEPDSYVWDLYDGGKWKKQNKFPVYALPGVIGQTLMEESSLYSGNMTSVPNGHTLAELFDPRDYVRLWADIDTSSGSTLPTLWVFLLVVLGILLLVIFLTSLTMHWLQRRRRQRLRRRIAEGEVDLEALGIKRLTVPQRILDQMPLYTYGNGSPSPAPAPVSTVHTRVAANKPDDQSSRSESPSLATVAKPTLPRHDSYRPTPLSQPTCAICLEDFVAPSEEDGEGTIVRELPCHHIFHPECVDAFLRDNSSLCPLCKKTALPRGYCPRIVTNAMVRRERLVRRMREQVTETEPTSSSALNSSGTPENPSFSHRLRSLSPMSLFSNRHRNASTPLVLFLSREEMADVTPVLPWWENVPPPIPLRSTTTNNSTNTSGAAAASPPTSSSLTSPPQPQQDPSPQQVQPPSNPTRREWARERALEMLGGRSAPPDLEAEEAARRPRWRKMLGTIWPSVA